MENIDQQKCQGILQVDQRHLLEHIAAGALLDDVLLATVALLDEKYPDVLCSIMLLDLDNFKMLNDAHGHYFGDMLFE